MVLYQPSARQIKSLALTCIKVWPDAEDTIWRAAAILGVAGGKGLRPDYHTDGSLLWRCTSQAEADVNTLAYTVGCGWQPKPSAQIFPRSHSQCTCPAWRYNPTMISDSDKQAVRICKHGLAWHMLRRLLEDQGKSLGYPTHANVTWHNLDRVDRMGLTSQSMAHFSTYLAVHRFHPADIPPQSEWQPSVPFERMREWWRTGSIS